MGTAITFLVIGIILGYVASHYRLANKVVTAARTSADKRKAQSKSKTTPAAPVTTSTQTGDGIPAVRLIQPAATNVADEDRNPTNTFHELAPSDTSHNGDVYVLVWLNPGTPATNVSFTYGDGDGRHELTVEDLSYEHPAYLQSTWTADAPLLTLMANIAVCARMDTFRRNEEARVINMK